MKTFIIGDIHNYIDWIEPFLEANPHDGVIFLGDYFDNFADNEHVARKTAKWLANSVHKENRIHLMGNHDMPYRFPWNNYFDCPGWTPAKQRAISSEFEFCAKMTGYSPWSKIKLAHFDHEHRYVYSHAGLTQKLFTVCPINGANLKDYEKEINTALEECNNKGSKRIPIVQQNPDYTYDGITWVRWWNIKLLPEVTQVVGHTPTFTIQNCEMKDATPLYMEGWDGAIWNLDCAHSWIGVMEDGEFYCVRRDDPEHTILKKEFYIQNEGEA